MEKQLQLQLESIVDSNQVIGALVCDKRGLPLATKGAAPATASGCIRSLLDHANALVKAAKGTQGVGGTEGTEGTDEVSVPRIVGVSVSAENLTVMMADGPQQQQQQQQSDSAAVATAVFKLPG